MAPASRRRVLAGGLFGVACACVAAPRFAYAYAESPTGKWMCPPCGCSADGKEFDKAGDCPACGMPLAPKPKADVPPAPKASDVEAGSNAKV
jgi:hypothetical protein